MVSTTRLFTLRNLRLRPDGLRLCLAYSHSDTLHGVIPYRVRSRKNILQFSPLPDGFHTNSNVLRLHQCVPSAPPHRIPTQFISSYNPAMHIRQRSADFVSDNFDQFVFPPHSHSSEPNFDMNIEPVWYLSPNAKPKYEKSAVHPVSNVPQNHMLDWMHRRAESPSKLGNVQSYSGRSTPVRHFQYPLIGSSSGSAGKIVSTAIYSLTHNVVLLCSSVHENKYTNS